MLYDNYELRYLPLFHDELMERALYIAQIKNSPDTANALVDDVQKAIEERVKLNPEGYESIPSNRDTDVMYYRIYVKNYIVYYVVLEEDGHKIMEVRRFVHNLENRDEKV